MSTRRERAKAPNVQLNKQLAAAEESARIFRENSKKNLRYAEVFTDLAKLVFGGVIIGGVFEEMDHPIYLYTIGIMGFLFLMWIGTMYYNKGIKVQINYIDSWGHTWKGKVAWPKESKFIEYLNNRLKND